MPFAGGRVVMALEGGYDLTTISECAEECVRALRSPATKGASPILPPVEEMHKIPNQSAQETIQKVFGFYKCFAQNFHFEPKFFKVIAVHKRHWPCLTGVQGINTSELHWQTISQRFSSLTM
jgi:hypothetical protein